MRWIPIVALACLTATALATTLSRNRAADEGRSLDRARTTYLEDEATGRQLAELDLRLTADADGQTRLRIRVSALGALVDPLPGYRGVQGANHITARELTELYRGGQLSVVVMSRDASGKPAGGKRRGEVRAATHGRIPERRLRPDGTLQFDAESADTYLLALDAISPQLGVGEHEVYLEARGIPRLRTDLRIAADAGTILAVRCLAGHDLELQR